MRLLDPADWPRLKGKLKRWHDDPLGFVREAVGDEPDRWQLNALEALVDEGLGSKRFRVALQACKGPGKSRLMAWVIWWFLLTRRFANISALSITSDNLKANLWKELSLVYGQAKILEQFFEVTTEQIVHRKHRLTWWCQARSFAQDADPQAQKASIAGLHGKHVMVVLDEAGGMPVGLLVAAEGIFANDVEAYLVIGGNPDTVDGALYEACVTRAHRFHVIAITGDPDDPDRSPRIDIEQARQWIEDWGRDNPWVMVNVLGQFPPTGANKLLGPEDIRRARARPIRGSGYEQEPRIGGLDVAAGGLDESSLTIRQGIVAWDPVVWHEDDLMKLADIMASVIVKEKLDALLIGVAGLGIGLFNRLVQLGYGNIVMAIQEAGAPSDPRFFQVRDYMWWTGCDWIKKYGSLPQDRQLEQDILAPTCEHKTIQRRTLFKLEDSTLLKKRLGRSPDRGTSLMLTFAAPVAPKGLHAVVAARALDEAYVPPWERRA